MKKLRYLSLLFFFLFSSFAVVTAQEMDIDSPCTPEGIEDVASYFEDTADELRATEDDMIDFMLPTTMSFTTLVIDMIVADCEDNLMEFETEEWSTEQIEFEDGLHRIWSLGVGTVQFSTIEGECAILGGNPLSDTDSEGFGMQNTYLIANSCTAIISGTGAIDGASIAHVQATFGDFEDFEVIVAEGNTESATDVPQTTEETEEATPTGFTRDNAVPFGEYFTFSTGEVRVLEVEERTPDFMSFNVPEGETLYYISLEYLCQVEGQDELCTGTDVARDNVYVSNSGNVVDTAPVYEDQINAVGNEAYSGATLTGGFWFSIPDDVPNLMRIDLEVSSEQGYQPIFFDLSS